MVRNGQPWELGEPDVNDHGLPVIHSIADKLDCIRLNRHMDASHRLALPEDESSVIGLSAQLEYQQQSTRPRPNIKERSKDDDSNDCGAFPSEEYYLNNELYAGALASNPDTTMDNALKVPQRGFICDSDFNFDEADFYQEGHLLPSPSSSLSISALSIEHWPMHNTAPEPSEFGMYLLQ